ncbi:MAG: 30S ribosomal protein S8, partial [Erysipelotrichaceae bacterium]|nr:30S ribosomal protein S8 [Erysipelotrichaceae bacterium]
EHDTVVVPASKMKVEIARILKQEGYISGYKVEGETAKDRTITVELKYGPDNQKVITGLKRISKPGLRVYAKGGSVPRVLNGLGIAIISTSKGLMTDRDARKNNLGGEVIAYVW